MRRLIDLIGRAFADWRTWFGPKIVGYGLEPKTWQGYVIIIGIIVVIVIYGILADPQGFSV